MDLKKHMSFRIINKLSLIDRFQFLISLLDSLVKNLNKDGFNYLSQEFDNNVLNLVKEKGFYHNKRMTHFEKFKEQLRNKEKFSSSLTGKRISDKEHEHVLKIYNKFEMKKMRDYHDLYLKCDIFLLADIFVKNFESMYQNNNAKKNMLTSYW